MVRKKLLGCGLAMLIAAASLLGAAIPARAADKKPNILVIWGDDIGRDNISAYSLGIMGYKAPNIDRIAKDGALFTDSYAQQSCTTDVVRYLASQGVPRNELSAQGVGDSRPVASNDTAAGRAKNRRVEIVIRSQDL